MQKQIEKTAENYQTYNRQAKELEAKMKPLKKKLIDYAEKHKSEFDEAFQMKFPNGTYISLRVKDALEGSKEAKEELLGEVYEEFAKVSLDEPALLEALPENARLRKLLTKFDIKVGQKETLAVYAG